MRCLYVILFVALSVHAETVMVKYRGPVNLDKFECQQSPQSSVVWRTCYSERNQYLVVNLRGAYYHYCRVPKAVVNEWRGSASLGRYYGDRIKGNFDCRQGGVPD